MSRFLSIVGVAFILSAAWVVALGHGVHIASAARAAHSDARPVAACVPRHHFSTVSPGVLTMSTAPSLPYFDYDETHHKLLGADGGIVAAIAKLECLKTAVQVLTGASALQAVISKRADISVGGWYTTPERGKVVGQTVPMYYDFTAIISKQGISRASKLKGMTVGCVQGSLFVAPLQALLGASNVRLYQLSDAVMNDLEAGRIQAAVLGSGEGGYLLKKKGGGFKLRRATPEKDFSPSLTAGAVDLPHTKSNKALGRALNADITLLRHNGVVKRVLHKWGFNNPNNFQLKP